MKRMSLVLSLVLLVAFVACVFCLPHDEYRMILQKLATRMMLPVGIIWMGLIVACFWSFGRREKRLGVCFVALLIFYTATTNEYIASVLAWSLERSFLDVRPFDQEPFDGVVLLGGGTSRSANGVDQLTMSGDRLALAARIFHHGLTDRIYCTGQNISDYYPHRHDPAEEAAAILMDLGVPENRITKLKGYNTQQEMRCVAELDLSSQRIGLVTSAWHLPRALRLARAEGLQLAPLPSSFFTLADFRFVPDPRHDIVPSSMAANQISICVKEYLAYLVGR